MNCPTCGQFWANAPQPPAPPLSGATTFVFNSGTRGGKVACAEYGSGPVARKATLTATPGGPALAAQSGVSVTLPFLIGSTHVGFPTLTPNTDYFLTIDASQPAQAFIDLA
jgi:hypothetical protein